MATSDEDLIKALERQAKRTNAILFIIALLLAVITGLLANFIGL